MAAAGDAYAEHLFAGGKSVATVATDLGAVRWWAAAAGIEGAARLGADAIADARRDGDRRRRGRGQAGAVDWDAADKIARRAAADGTPKGLRDAALIATASDLCARVSEVAALRVRDLECASDGTATAEVWQGKTGRARTGYLRASTGPETRRMARGRRDRCRRRPPVPGPRPLGPDQGRGPGHAAARRGRCGAPARRRHRAPSHRPLAPGRGRRLDGEPPGPASSPCSRPGDGPRRICPPTTGRQASARSGPVATLRAEDRWA